MPKQSPAIEVTFDKIRAWLNNSETVELSDNDKKIYERWDYAYDQLKVEKPAAVVQRLKTKFGISTALAYKDLRDCQKLLSPANRRDADWIQNFIIEELMLQIKVGRESLDKTLWQKATENLTKIWQTLKGDTNELDTELLGNNKYFIVIGNKSEVQKIDYDKISELPTEKLVEITDFLFSELESEKEAESIMKS